MFQTDIRVIVHIIRHLTISRKKVLL